MRLTGKTEPGVVADGKQAVKRPGILYAGTVIKPALALPLFLIAALGCGKAGSSSKLVDARQGFQTRLVHRESERTPPDVPPPDIFRLVTYDSPAGKLSAYLTTAPNKGPKRPAIVWITGGDCNSIGECWKPATPDNDQTAAAFREAGIVMMFPSMRGGNDNPGQKEGFLGEVDDVLAAAEYLSKQPEVDPRRIYLGGHSTGGTLVLLCAECSDRFRAVFSFGPADDPSRYPDQFIPFDRSNRGEFELRAPGRWLDCVKTPTFVFEGALQGNVAALQAMERSTKNSNLNFYLVRGRTHFSILAPVTRIVAKGILDDSGPSCTIAFIRDELER